MGMPVKLSDHLVRAARVEAKALDRSITSQIEHWAKVGQAVEVALGYVDVRALKASAGDLRRAIPDEARRHAIVAVLERIATQTDRLSGSERSRAGGRPVYGTDPAFPGLLVRVDADGTRTPGRLENRRFVPDTSHSDASHR